MKITDTVKIGIRGTFGLLCFSFFCGCGHTLPAVSRKQFEANQTGKTLGIEYVFDVNQFNYADEVKSEIDKARCFKDVVLTHDVSDSRCDAVIKGNFSYYVIDVHNQFFYTSIYMFYIPLITGLPYTHVEGSAMANFEVYQKGQLFKTYAYKDVFWGQTGWLPLYFPPDPGKEVRRLSRYLLRDIMRDLYGVKND